VNSQSAIAGARNLHSDDPEWVFVIALVTIAPASLALGIFMVWRPEQFIRRRRIFKAADAPILPGEILYTRAFGTVWTAFTIFWTVSVIVALVT
jgi:hypothetical protein